MQCISVRVAMIQSHFRSIEQQGVTSGVRFALGHGGIDIGTVIQQEVEPRTLIVWVITKIPVHENDRSAELITSIRISAGLEHALQKGSRPMYGIAHCK